MKAKKSNLFDEEPFSSKKKFKPHSAFKDNQPFEENGIVTDNQGNLIKIGSIVEFELNHLLVEGEVTEIQSNNLLTVIVDDIITNDVNSHYINSWNVNLLQF